MFEMIIKVAKIKGQAEKIRAVGRKISNRNFVLSFNKSKGDLVDELRNMENALQNIGTALTALTESTGTQLDKAAEEFLRTDNRIARWFRGTK